MSTLHEISGRHSAKPEAEVLFVHGLGGDAYSTWRHGPDNASLWPSWVAGKYPAMKVWSLGYAAAPTKLARFKGWFSRAQRDQGQSMALPDRATQVLDLMVQRGFGQRPILFVAHSLGGLLVKQVLRTAKESVDARQRAIFERTRGVLFLATPHAGADLASLADSFRIIFRGTVSMEDLRAHDAHLRNLFDWYRNHSVPASIQTVTYFETRSYLGATIVNPTSAHPGVGKDPVGLDENHISISKPGAPDSQVCGALDQMIHDLIPGLGTTSVPAPGSPPPLPLAVRQPSPPAIHPQIHLDADLRELVARGLLHHDTRNGRFDLHPIVRRYAYDRLAAPDRAATHTQLRDYFAAVPPPDKVTCLEDLDPVIELYHHTLRAGQLDEAYKLYKDRLDPLYYQLGAYQLIIDLLRPLFPDGEDRPPRLKNEGAQPWTLNELANSYSASGQPRRAVPLFQQQIAVRDKQGKKRSVAIGLVNLAVAQISVGALRATEANLRRSIALCGEIKAESDEAIGHQELGRLLAYRGADAEAETELATALQMFENQKLVQSQGVVWAYRALRKLLRLRLIACEDHMKSETSDLPSVLASARRAKELADECARTRSPNERDYVRAHWLLGAAHRIAGQPDKAEHHLHEALERCHRINVVYHEADILIDLARLRAATGAAGDAQRLTEEALLIADRSGYVLQAADAHLELAKLALSFYAVPRPDPAAAASFPAQVRAAVGTASPDQRTLALHHAQKAHRLATCDGPPDYTYKAAYLEATALLEELG